MELEKQKMRHRDDQGLLVSENEELTGKIEELKSEMVSNWATPFKSIHPLWNGGV